jgi:dTDP-4-amino-4,6-dideoxygalactose transaminase
MQVTNFYPEQYKDTLEKDINHNYLAQQFIDYPEIFKKIEQVVRNGDYTLGHAVDEFEKNFAEKINSKYAIGVGSGTDALMLSLKALDIGAGDEVITTPFTFYATIGAIVTAGATPVFVDIEDDYNISASKIESAITDKTKAILPVHWSGKPCDMDEILTVAKANGLKVVEDSCHGIQATYKDKYAGTFGDFGCFSMHPLKNLNVWGDGGLVCTQDEELACKMRLMRNHGLVDRDHCQVFAYNSRLDTVQAVVADHLLQKIDFITKNRIANAEYLDNALSEIPQVTIPRRDKHHTKQVYHIYSLLFERRDELSAYLASHGVDAKAHYPIPMHLQPAAKQWGYQKGDFPVTEKTCDMTLSLPVHEFIETSQLSKMITLIKDFYA